MDLVVEELKSESLLFVLIPIMLLLVKRFWGLKTQPNGLIHRSLKGSLMQYSQTKKKHSHLYTPSAVWSPSSRSPSEIIKPARP